MRPYNTNNVMYYKFNYPLYEYKYIYVCMYVCIDQSSLESDYKRKLMDDFGITFNSLFTLTNMPIKRFADLLFRTGELEAYMTLLVNNFNPAAVNGVMCRNTLSVGWDGSVYDCDFNQQLAISLGEISTDQRLDQEEGLNSSTASASASARKFKSADIDLWMIFQSPVDLHRFGCTAGAGSLSGNCCLGLKGRRSRGNRS